MNPPREGSRVLRRNRLRSVRRRNLPVLRAVLGASRKPAFSALLENGLQSGYSLGLTAWAALKRLCPWGAGLRSSDSLGLTAWAALKLGLGGHTPTLFARFPGPHGLGSVEASSFCCFNSCASSDSLGLTAWAALKPSEWRQRSLRPPIFPGPHGLGSVEARGIAPVGSAFFPIPWASRPGQR